MYSKPTKGQSVLLWMQALESTYQYAIIVVERSIVIVLY